MTPPADRVVRPAEATRVARLALVVLGLAVAVILWGAVVRATGSGAGCGQHWPDCNGLIVPLRPRLATIIEYAHRLTSGLLLVLVLILAIGAFQIYPRGHGARSAAGASLVFVLIEAAVGAGIVLLQLVEHNASAMRAGYIGVHLVNTMFLVGALTATWWWASPHARRVPVVASPRSRRPLMFGMVAMLAVCASGAVVALGDTLFPHASMAADFDPTSHVLIRLRVWHPALAVIVSLYLATITQSRAFAAPALRAPGRIAFTLIIGQIALGAVNLFLHAPLTLQMAHLLVANALWIALVWAWLELRPASTRGAVSCLDLEWSDDTAN